MQPLDIKSIIKKTLIGVVIAIVIIAGLELYSNRHFRVVNTSPRTGNISTDSPFFKINFDRKLVSQGLKLSSSPSVIKDYSTNGNTLTVNLKYPLSSSTQYTISVESIRDNKGEYLYNKLFRFKPKYVQFSSLSTEQQEAILQNQIPPATKNSINFSGLDALTTRGITSAQVNDLQQALFNYSSKIKSVQIDASSIAPVPHDPNSASTSDAINFNLKIDSQTYKATVSYSNLNTLRLYLYDSSGKLVFDSGDITSG